MSSTPVDLSAMSVKQLKRYIAAAGLDPSSCVEKAELLSLAHSARARFDADPSLSSTPAAPSGPRQQILAGFDCTLVGGKPGAQPALVVLLLHGFGASSADFADVPQLCAGGEFQGREVAFVFPQAKVGAMGVPEWWPIDVQRWIMSRYLGEAGLEALTRETPPGVEEARGELVLLLREVVALYGHVCYGRVALGGFSQGAMTALNVMLHLPRLGDAYLGGCFLLSGAPIGTATWGELFAADEGIKGIPVFLSHGERDEVLPVQGADICRALLEAQGVTVDAVRHGEGHSLGPREVIGRFVAFLKRVMDAA